jgi:hypothetical protein
VEGGLGRKLDDVKEQKIGFAEWQKSAADCTLDQHVEHLLV